jgi:hypothetical protein
MTPEEKQQFNKIFFALQRIAKDYKASYELREDCEEEYGLEYEEVLEMTYENIQSDAAMAIIGIKSV